MQLSLTKDQRSKLEALGARNVKALLEAGKFGSYRRPFIQEWLDGQPPEAFEEPEVPILFRKFDL